MKNIFPKIYIHPSTYIFIMTFLLTGHIKSILLILSIILIHEWGHILINSFFHYPINQVTIYPFGGLTKTTKFMNTPINHDILIYLGGFLAQFILLFVFYLFYRIDVIHLTTYQLFKTYNKAILVFNMLPIRPLDGGELVRLFLEKFLPFAKAQSVANGISVLSLVIFILLNYTYSLNNYLICMLLMVKLYDVIKTKSFVQNKFYLERCLYTFPYQRIRYEKDKNIKALRKDTRHYFWEGNTYISEKKILQEKFDIPYNF